MNVLFNKMTIVHSKTQRFILLRHCLKFLLLNTVSFQKIAEAVYTYSSLRAAVIQQTSARATMTPII